jgi:hypothetical protein
VPAGDVQGGNRNAIDPIAHGDRGPVVVACAMCVPPADVRGDLTERARDLRRVAPEGCDGIIGQRRERSRELRRARGIQLPEAIEVGSAERGQEPGEDEAELEHAALVDPAFPVLRARAVGRHGEQRGRTTGGREQLCRTDVRASVHRDVSVAPRLAGDPCDGVLAIGHLLGERIERAVRGEAAAHVLDDHGESLLDRANGVDRVRGGDGAGSIVRRALQERRCRCAVVPAIGVGTEDHAVAHCHLDRAIDPDRGRARARPHQSRTR